jgi:small nuclear ribonucleoprotein (snRNP)-like protein
MKPTRILQALSVVTLLALGLSARADVVEMSDGSRLIGTITKVDLGTVYLKTAYAGDLKIDQKLVTAMTTDKPISVRLKSGTALEGKVTAADGQIAVVGEEATVTTSVSKVAAVWPAGAVDPDILAKQHHWSFEAGLDIEGKTGNSDQLGTAGSFRAKLTGPEDVLQFYTAYNRQVTDGAKSADQFKAGIDYADNFSDKTSWYARDEAGFDRVMDIDFYNISAAGLGYDFIKLKAETLTVRAGLSYRYDEYSGASGTPVLSSTGGDFEIDNTTLFKYSKMVNTLSYVPAFSNYNNYVIQQDSYYEIPMADPKWKLRLGVSNNYESIPVPGTRRLDTTYYTRLLLDWQ